MGVFEPLSELLDRAWKASAAAAVVGGLLCAVAALLNFEQFLRSYLTGFLFWWMFAVGSLGLLMLYYLIDARWGLATRPFLEWGAAAIPLAALFFVPIALSLDWLYPWTDESFAHGHGVAAHAEHDEHDGRSPASPEVPPAGIPARGDPSPEEASLDASATAPHDHVQPRRGPPTSIDPGRAPMPGKEAYLNKPFFLARAIVYFALWSLWLFLLRPLPRGATPRRPRSRRLLGATGLAMLILTVSFAAMDWAMSLEPHWFSSMYGGIVAVGGALIALALTTAIVGGAERWLRNTNLALPANIYADLGTLLFAILMMWGYLSLSQYLIIWSGNLPEEAIYYVSRQSGGWQWAAVALVGLHFVIPFALLLSTGVKRRPGRLAAVAVWLLVMQLAFIWWTVAPAFHPTGFYLHYADLAAPLAIGGIWGLAMIPLLRRRLAAVVGPRPIVPPAEAHAHG